MQKDLDPSSLRGRKTIPRVARMRPSCATCPGTTHEAGGHQAGAPFLLILLWAQDCITKKTCKRPHPFRTGEDLGLQKSCPNATAPSLVREQMFVHRMYKAR